MLYLAPILAAASIASVEAHGYLARPTSKQHSTEQSYSLPHDEHFQKSSWWLDRAYFDGDRYATPWQRPGQFSWRDAMNLTSGQPKIFHPCGCYSQDTVQTCAAVGGLAPTFGSTTNGPLGPGPDIIPATWPAGSEQHTAFNLHANHAGGYLYTLCPYASYDACAHAFLPQDEAEYLGCVWECFDKHVLEFVPGSQTLQYHDDESQLVMMDAVEVSSGTWPAGSTWREVPIADVNQGNSAWSYVQKGPTGAHLFSSPEVHAHFEGDFGPESCCSAGPEGHTPGNWHIKDRVRVPVELASGRYLLSWRWDCYMADQIWTNCADVEVVGSSDGPAPAPPPAPPTPTAQAPTPAPGPEPEPEPEPVPGPECEDMELPTEWSHNGVYGCDTYENHGGTAYCAHAALDASCCFCRQASLIEGGSTLSSVRTVAAGAYGGPGHRHLRHGRKLRPPSTQGTLLVQTGTYVDTERLLLQEAEDEL